MGRWIMVDIYRDATFQVINLALDTNPEGDSCLSIYKKMGLKNSLFSKKQYNVSYLFSIF